MHYHVGTQRKELYLLGITLTDANPNYAFRFHPCSSLKSLLSAHNLLVNLLSSFSLFIEVVANASVKALKHGIARAIRVTHLYLTLTCLPCKRINNPNTY